MFLRGKASTDLSDEDLVSRLCQGHRDPLGVLWDRYAHLLLGVGLKYLKEPEAAKDEVVELFTTLPALLGQHTVERFRPWVHVVMRNRCLLRLRSQGRSHPVADELIIGDDDREDRLLHEASLAQLEEALQQLNEEQRACIRLFYWERQSYERIAERTGHSPEQVRSHLQNGRRNLKIKLQHHADRKNS